MHFHHRNTALISAKRMFMLAMPPTTFHLISSDGKARSEKRLSKEDDKTAQHQRTGDDNSFDESSR